jgi:hypothetical protein
MTGKGIVDAANTTNTITANGESSEAKGLKLTADGGDVVLNNTILTSADILKVTAEKGSVTLNEKVESSHVVDIYATNVTAEDVTSESKVYVNAEQEATLGIVKGGEYVGVEGDSITAEAISSGSGVRLIANDSIEVGKIGAGYSLDANADTVDVDDITAGKVDITTNKGATFGNITSTEKYGIIVRNVEKTEEVYNEETQDEDFVTTKASGDIVIKGALSANLTTESQEGQDPVVTVGAGNIEIENEGGYIVLGKEGKNATINAGTVAMTAKGIEDVESTTNSITANNSGDSMYPVMTLTATDGDIALSNTTLNAPKGGLFATAENASVKITKDMEADSVEISAHSGIEVGDITATGDNGITLSNTLSVENQQTPEEATGDITAGKLTAQYEMDQQTYGGMIQIINKSEQEMISDQSQTTTEDERNINLTDVTGGEIIIKGKDNLTSTGKIEGDYINISSAKTDLNELEGNDFWFDVGELKANSIKDNSDYVLLIGSNYKPIDKADIGSIEAASVNIKTNQGATIGNISITDNGQDSDFPNKISINNVDYYDFEKCRENYFTILDALSPDDKNAVRNEYGDSFNSAINNSDGKTAIKILADVLQMAEEKGADLSGISVDPADYLIKEAANDITIKGAFQLATANNDSDAHSSKIAEESKFNVKVLNQGGDIKLDGATIDAGTVTMTAENIVDAEDVPNSIIANMKEQSDSSSSDNESINALELTATEGDISLANTVIKSNGDSLISAVSGDVIVEQDIYSGNDLGIAAKNAILNNVEAGNDIKIIAEESLTSTGDMEAGNDLGVLTLNAEVNNVKAVNTLDIIVEESLTSTGDLKSEKDLGIIAQNAEVNNVQAENTIAITVTENLTSTGDLKSEKDLGISARNAEVNNVQAGNTLTLLVGESLTSTGDIVADGKVNILAGDITTANGIYGENVTLDGDSLALGDVVAINEVEINANENISADNIAGNNVLMEATTVDEIGTIYSESELNITAEKINNIEEIKASNVEITTTKGMKLGVVEVLSESGSFVAKNIEEESEPVYQSVDVSSLENNEGEEAGNNIEINSVIIDKSDSEPTNEPNSSQLVLGTLELEGEGTEVSEEEGNIKIINEIGDVKVNETLTAKNVDVSAYGSMNGSAVINAEEKVTVDAGENVEFAEINAENVEISAGGDVEAGQVNADNVSVIAENNIGIDSIEGKEVTLSAGGDMELAEVSAEKVNAFAEGNLGANSIEGAEVTLSAGENVNVAEVTGDEVAVNAGSNMIVGNISGNKVLLTAKGDIEAESFDVGEKLTVEAENVNIGEVVAEGLIDLTANGELEAESLVTGDEMVAMATNAYIGEAVAGTNMEIGVIDSLTAESLEADGNISISADRIELGDVEAGKNLIITSIPVDETVDDEVSFNLRSNTSEESDADLVAENLKAGDNLIVSAEKAEIGNAEGSFVKIGTEKGLELDTVTAKASGEDKYDAVIYNAESGDVNVNNVKVENGNVRVANVGEDGNVTMKDVTAGNIYVASENDLTVESAKATSEDNNSVEGNPYTSGLYLAGQNVTVDSAESASDYMKIAGGYVELLDKDGKLSKIYKENPVLEEGVDVYRFADDVVDVPETMTDTLENLVEAGKIILCTKEEPTPEPEPQPQPSSEMPDDVIEEAKATIKTQDDNNTAQGQNNENLDIQLNLNANIDLGGQREITNLDLEGGSDEERLQITMGSDGTIELMPKEHNQVVNEDDQTGDNVNIDGNSNDNGEDLDNGENLANGQLVANDENLGNNEDNEDNGVVENLENNEDGDENSGNNLRRNRRNNRRNRNNRGNRGNRGQRVDRLNRVNTTTLLNKLG